MCSQCCWALTKHEEGLRGKQPFRPTLPVGQRAGRLQGSLQRGSDGDRTRAHHTEGAPAPKPTRVLETVCERPGIKRLSSHICGKQV